MRKNTMQLREKGPRLNRRSALKIAGIGAGTAFAAIIIQLTNRGRGEIPPTPTTAPTIIPEKQVFPKIEDLIRKPVRCIEVLNNTGQNPTLLVAFDGGILTSNDQGTNWSNLPIEGAKHFYPTTVTQTSKGDAFIGTSFGEVLKVTPQSAQRVAMIGNANLSISAISADPKEGKRMVLGTLQAGIFETKDAGQNWAAIPSWPNDINTATIQNIAFDPQNPDHIYAGTMNRGLWKSENNGGSWGRLKVVQEDEVRWVHALKTTRERVLAGTNNGLYASEDQGNSWRKKTDLRVQLISPSDKDNPTTIATEREIYDSPDLRTWRRLRVVETDILSLANHPAKPNVVLAGTEKGIIEIRRVI